MIYKIITLTIFLCHSALLFSQNEGDLEIAKSLFLDFQPTNEGSVDLDSLQKKKYSNSKSLGFYKNYISSQDQDVCSFFPSCSEYSSLALKKHGLAEGLLLTFDRLNRCHNFCIEKYPVHEPSGLQYDPIESEKEHDH